MTDGFRATCEDCGWEYEHEYRSWVREASDNHEAMYRTDPGHDTEIERAVV